MAGTLSQEGKSGHDVSVTAGGEGARILAIAALEVSHAA